MQIEVKNLTFGYEKQTVLDHLSFCVEKGTLTAVLGPNGAGKSTLFRCLLGFLRPKEGEILLCGQRPGIGRELSRLVAYIPQSSEPIYNYTVTEAVLMGATGSIPVLKVPSQVQLEAVNEALHRLGIDHLAHRGICRISGGERQLVLLARALVQNAQILIMDEPTANLDYGNQYRVLKQIKALAAQGYTILMSTHNPEHALSYADNILALHDGKICAHGPAEATLTAELIEKLYGISVQVTKTGISF